MYWKKSLLVIEKILRLFVNTLLAEEKHYLLNRDNLTQPIHIQLCQNQKTFSQFFFAFLKSVLNFKGLPKKDDRHSSCFSGNLGSEKYGYIYFSKAVFQRTLRHTTWRMGRNIIAVWMAAPLKYLLITLKVVSLEKVSFSNTQNPKTFC